MLLDFNVFCLILKVDGTKVAVSSDDGTVIVFCYPVDGRKVFRRNGRSNFPIIVWNPFNRDMLASYNNAVSGKKHSAIQKCDRFNKSDESKK
jgi:hypothetical protein